MLWLMIIALQGIIIIPLSLTLGSSQVPNKNRKLQAKWYPASCEGSVWTCDCLLSSVQSDSQENNSVNVKSNTCFVLLLISRVQQQLQYLPFQHPLCAKVSRVTDLYIIYTYKPMKSWKPLSIYFLIFVRTSSQYPPFSRKFDMLIRLSGDSQKCSVLQMLQNVIFKLDNTNEKE